jgi:hypothetical protein
VIPRGSLTFALPLALLVASGCGQPSVTPPVDAGRDSGAGGADIDAGKDAGSDADAGADATGPGVTGVLLDEGEQPLGNIAVLACTAKFCLFGQSEANGHFAFPFDPPVDVAVKTQEDLTTSPRLGAALVPVRIVDSSLVDLGNVHVPTLPVGAKVGPESQDPQTLLVGDGLELTVRRADLDPPLGALLDDLAARAIPTAHLHPLPALGAEEILAVYALHPFTTTSLSPIAVRAPSTLAAGTAVYFRSVSELDGRLSAPVLGHADGAFVKTDPADGIAELTWLVISR